MPTKITNQANTQCSIIDCIETAASGVTQGAGGDTFSQCDCPNALTGPSTAGGAANIAKLFAVSAGVIGLTVMAKLASGAGGVDGDPAKVLERAIKDFAAELFKYGVGEERLTPEMAVKLSDAIRATGESDAAAELERYFTGMKRGEAQDRFGEFLIRRAKESEAGTLLKAAETYAWEVDAYAKRDGTSAGWMRAEKVFYVLADAFGSDVDHGQHYQVQGARAFNEGERLLKEEAKEHVGRPETETGAGGAAAAAAAAGVTEAEFSRAIEELNATKLAEQARAELQRGNASKAIALFQQVAEVHYKLGNYQLWYSLMREARLSLKGRPPEVAPLYREMWTKSLAIWKVSTDPAQQQLFWERAGKNYSKEIDVHVNERKFREVMATVITMAEKVAYLSSERRDWVGRVAKTIIEDLYSERIKPTQDVLDALAEAERYINSKKFEGHSALIKSINEWQALQNFVEKYPSLRPTDQALRALSADIAAKANAEVVTDPLIIAVARAEPVRPRSEPPVAEVKEIVDTLRDTLRARSGDTEPYRPGMPERPGRPEKPTRPTAIGREHGRDGVDGKGRGCDDRDAEGKRGPEGRRGRGPVK